MNKIYRFLLLGALVCGLGLSVTSCSDDDDKKVDERIVTEDGKTYVPDSLLTDHERYQLACQFAVIGTLRSLAGLERMTPDIVNETHEPIYGMTLDDVGPTVRVKKCESTAEAELSFRSIAGLDSADAARMYTPTPDGYTLSLKDLPILADGKKLSLGTLTFHRDGGPRRYGWVDVDIPCIPHLERIDYLGPEAFPDNAAGNSAYQLGDIVFVSRGSGYCSGYYICIQPYAYNDGWLVHMNINEPGDDETINADGDSNGCYYPYNKSKGQSTVYDMINVYFNFICNEQQKVDNIKTFLNGEAINLKPSVSGKIYHIFPEGFNNTNGVPFVSSDGRDGRIWYDGYVTDEYAVVPAYNYRKGHFAAVAHNVKYWHDDSFTYVTDSSWEKKWRTHWNYIMNAIRFTTSTINGATIEYSVLNDNLETIENKDMEKYSDYNFVPYKGTGGTGNEGYDKLFDGDTETKWGTSEKQNGAYFVEFMSKGVISPSKYYLTTGNDNSRYTTRNPKSWKLYGKKLRNDPWTTIATVNNDNRLPADNFKCVEYNLDVKNRDWQYFRLEISTTGGDPFMQLSEFEFDVNE